MARHLTQLGTKLCGDTAPGLKPVGARRAGLQAGSLEVEVAASYTGSRVFRLAAAPQTLTVAALTACCAGQSTGAGAHCEQRTINRTCLLATPQRCYFPTLAHPILR